MFRSGFIVFRILLALVVLGAIAAGVFMAFQAGQAQGYALGAASAAGNGSESQAPGGLAPVPGYPYMMRGYGYGHFGPHFFPFGLFCFGGLALLALFAVGGLFRRGWRHHAWAHGPWGYGPWGHGPEGHGKGPWKEGEGQPDPRYWGPPPWWRGPNPESGSEEKPQASASEPGEPKA